MRESIMEVYPMNVRNVAKLSVLPGPSENIKVFILERSLMNVQNVVKCSVV